MMLYIKKTAIQGARLFLDNKKLMQRTVTKGKVNGLFQSCFFYH